jgi:predicted nucleic acid-binding protein
VKKVFVDTDILLDLLSGREPFMESASILFSKADRKKIKIFVSSLSFSNLNYLLSRQFNVDQARRKLLNFKTLVTVLPVTEKTVELALSSEFKDFEDALQYYTAIENNIQTLLTRNLRDYKYATISVMTAEDFVQLS